MNLHVELDAALQAALEAASLCRSVRSTFDGSSLAKDDRSPVTVADFGSQALICRTLRTHFPNDPIVAEEGAAALRSDEAMLAEVQRHVAARITDATGEDVCRWIDMGDEKSYSSRFWTVDPIDGTKGFLRGDQYAIAIALIIDGLPVVSVLACPALTDDDAEGVTLFAVRGEGAFVADRGVADEARRIRASSTSTLAKAVVCESFESSHSAHDDAARVAGILDISADPIRMDSQAKYGLLALGRADIYLRLPVRAGYVEKIWDHAAGALIVEEAGGRVTDVDGRDLDFSQGWRLEGNRGVIATNGHLHDDVLEAVRQVLS